MKLGFFPCAPTRPTLAVDINLLQFVSFGFLNMAPNVTGWAKTIEDFLCVRGYVFRGAVCIISFYCLEELQLITLMGSMHSDADLAMRCNGINSWNFE
jgi:hypothetical protein